MYRGRKILGDEIRIGVQCRNGSRTPGAPTAAPTYRVYDETGTLVTSGSLPPTERYAVTGLFEYMLRLISPFTTGRYHVRYAYAISGTNYAALDSFEIQPSGNAGGQILSMLYLDRPDADWIVATTDQGTVSLNRGPRL